MKVFINNQELEKSIIYTSNFFENYEPNIISSKINKNYLYTIMIVDPDAPYPSNPTKKYVLHLLVVNSKDIKAKFHPPNPPEDSPSHRYHILIYKQPKYINIDYIGYITNFNPENFINSYNLQLVDKFTFHCKK